MIRKTLWPKVPAAFVQKNLTGHKILGLALAGILYLICLSGTVTVFYTDLERWETAGIPDAVFKPEGVAAAIGDARARQPKDATTIYLALPTRDLPRLTVMAGEDHLGYDSDGHYRGNANHPAGEGLTGLHYQLHLPSTIGLIVVGLGGLAIISLIVGGLLAHPRILKDAFLWRFKADARPNRSDLHNRIGVWAAPFHIAIALTGALIGLGQVVILIAALSFYKGDTVKAGAPLYGDTPATVVAGRLSNDAIVTAFAALKRDYPTGTPYYAGVNNLNTDHESFTVWVEFRERLVYGEQFDFDGKGQLIGRQHLPDGALGKQIYASLYKLHFGSFGGLWVRWLYTLLGLGLCIICTTGMDIWLLKSAQKGRAYPRLHKTWTGFVWGTPIAMTATATLCLALPVPFVPVFWGILTGLTGAGAISPDQATISRAGRLGLGIMLLGLVATHAVKFGATALSAAGFWPGLCLALCGMAFCLSGRWRRQAV